LFARAAESSVGFDTGIDYDDEYEHRFAEHEVDRAVLASQNQAVNGSRRRHES